MDPKTDELRAAHDVLSGFYRERLADALDHMPEDRAVLGLFCELVSKPARYADVARVLGLVPDSGIEAEEEALAVHYTPGRAGTLATWAPWSVTSPR